MTENMCAKCGKNFKSVKHNANRTGSHEFVIPTLREQDYLWEKAAMIIESGGREIEVEGQIIEIEETGVHGSNFIAYIKIPRFGVQRVLSNRFTKI